MRQHRHHRSHTARSIMKVPLQLLQRHGQPRYSWCSCCGRCVRCRCSCCRRHVVPEQPLHFQLLIFCAFASVILAQRPQYHVSQKSHAIQNSFVEYSLPH